MEPIIEINWSSIVIGLAILAFFVGIGMLVIKVTVAYAKKVWRNQ